jgi:hypothetical protein
MRGDKIMAKMITGTELGKIVNTLLTDPGAIDDAEQYSQFMTDLAHLVCEHAGGEVINPAWAGGITNLNADNWMVGIHANENIPDDGGIWKDYDTDVTFKNGEEL